MTRRLTNSLLFLLLFFFAGPLCAHEEEEEALIEFHKKLRDEDHDSNSHSPHKSPARDFLDVMVYYGSECNSLAFFSEPSLWVSYIIYDVDATPEISGWVHLGDNVLAYVSVSSLQQGRHSIVLCVNEQEYEGEFCIE